MEPESITRRALNEHNRGRTKETVKRVRTSRRAFQRERKRVLCADKCVKENGKKLPLQEDLAYHK